MPIKLYELEEHSAKEDSYLVHACAAQLASYEVSCECYTTYWRHKRFLDALKGFHTVCSPPASA